MNISMFDILGPVMIGPSSSHTAGAQRIGKAMYMISGKEEIDSVTFYLHGSFSHTLNGHGTDRALVAGLMGMDASDERIRNSLEIARSRGIKMTFLPKDLGDVHPNTVKIVAVTKSGKTYSMIGSSVGGGEVEVVEINGTKTKSSGKYPAVIVKHADRVGVISQITAVLAKNNVNIVTMSNIRQKKGSDATTMLEADGGVTQELRTELESLDYVDQVVIIEKFA